MRDIKKEAKDSLDKLRSQHRREIEDLNSKIADVSQRALQVHLFGMESCGEERIAL